jgi:hypothetical protein
MKKILFGVLFLTVFASSAVNQNSIIGNWAMVPREPDPSLRINLIKDTLNLTKDWKFSEISYYDINYPDYGTNKIDLKYQLKIVAEGEYRLDSELKKYPKNTTREIIEGSASDEGSANNSIKEIEKLIREEVKNFISILSASDTELELQSTSWILKFTKPKSLPVSKLTLDTIPFFAPEGWRFPDNAKELANFPKRLESKDKSLLTVAKGDFNGDGLRDAAAYLLNAETGQVALFVNMSQSDGSYELIPYGNADKNTVVASGVMLAPADEYIHATTKKKTTIENPGFMVIIFDTAATLVYWNGSSWASIPLGKKF